INGGGRRSNLSVGLGGGRTGHGGGVEGLSQHTARRRAAIRGYPSGGGLLPVPVEKLASLDPAAELLKLLHPVLEIGEVLAGLLGGERLPVDEGDGLVDAVELEERHRAGGGLVGLGVHAGHADALLQAPVLG